MSNIEPTTHSVAESTIGELEALPIKAQIIAIEALSKALPALLEAARESRLNSPADLPDVSAGQYVVQEPVDSIS